MLFPQCFPWSKNDVYCKQKVQNTRLYKLLSLLPPPLLHRCCPALTAAPLLHPLPILHCCPCPCHCAVLPLPLLLHCALSLLLLHCTPLLLLLHCAPSLLLLHRAPSLLLLHHAPSLLLLHHTPSLLLLHHAPSLLLHRTPSLLLHRHMVSCGCGQSLLSLSSLVVVGCRSSVVVSCHQRQWSRSVVIVVIAIVIAVAVAVSHWSVMVGHRGQPWS